MVLLLGLQAPVQTLSKPSTGKLCPCQVSDVVDWLFHWHVLDERHLLREVVVPVGNGKILDEIALMHDIGTSHGHFAVDDVVARLIHLGRNPHSGEVGAHLLVTELVQRQALLHPGGISDHASRLHLRIRQGLSTEHAALLEHQLHRLDLEGSSAILSKPGDHAVQCNLTLSLIHASQLNEDILGLQRDLGQATVDDWRHGQHLTVAVVDNGVHGRVLDNRNVLLDLLMRLEGLHQLVSCHLLVVEQRLELNVSGLARLVPERALDGIQIVSSDCHELSLPPDVGHHLLLQVDETVVPALV
mmetsp:Transcript_9958/g.21916  ORF Transcript_9958/g.21916 Transcript_9958/m.21916 type:complete len:301 (-) Transcript_9958:459-1361(-)